MGGLTSAVHWWEDSQLRVLVLTSLIIQYLLFLFSFLRRYAIPRWSRSTMWLAYLGGDAVAIYALATLFNRHKTDEHGRGGGGSSSTLEVVWAPVLLIHLGGHDGITAYNIEDNELWSRHLLTAVSQITVAIYVFCKSWPPGSDKRLLQAAILLFVPGVVKCLAKPWALKRASIHNLVSRSPADVKVKQNEGELGDYVKQAKDFVRQQNGEGEAQGARASLEDEEDRPTRCNKDPGTAIGTVIAGKPVGNVRGAWAALIGRVKGDLVGKWAFVRGLLKDDEGAPPSQGSFCGRLQRRPMERAREKLEWRSEAAQLIAREMLQGRSEACKLFVDLSSSYPRRLSILQDFWGLREEVAYGCVRQGLATAFLLLYTKLKTAAGLNFGYGDMVDEEGRLGYVLRKLILWLRLVLPWASIGLFHQSHREPYNDIDVKITYAMFCCTAVVETYSSLPLTFEGKTGEEWPEMIAQYSFIGCFARNIKHSREMWVLSLLECKDFLDQHLCMKPCFSSARISELVLGYLKHGWKEKIHDATSYRRFNDHHRSEGLTLMSTNRNRPLLFDESVLLWHIATDFCFFSSTFPEHRCAFAAAPTREVQVPVPTSAPMRQFGNEILHWGIQLVLGKYEFVEKNQTSASQCRQESPECKAILCRQMSNYMVYLLFINPEMLLPGSRRNLFTAAHEELQAMFKDDKKPPPEKRELTLKIIGKLESSSLQAGSGPPETIIHESWTIAQKLQSLGDEKMWEVIQGVWVEMLCFSASRCRGYLHAKALGKGGEFLSYVWLLLFYMGMETFTDKLQREEQDLPSHEAGKHDTADLTREVSTSTDRLQREDLTSQGQGGNKCTACTSEICKAADDMV